MKRTLSDRINKVCKKYNVISFDIFDTLLKRDVLYPKDIFYFVEKLYKFQKQLTCFEFVNRRIKAEKVAKEKSDFEEVTLEEIYSEMNLDDLTKRSLMKLELEVERNFLIANAEIKKVFDYCKNNKKKIYITSDMYLPKWFIEKILADNGYNGYTKLFLSNEYRVTKKTGNLFKVFLESEGVDAKDVLHIGDSRYSDLFSPRKVGIRGYYIKRKQCNTLYLRKGIEKDIMEQTALYSFINNRISFIMDRNIRLGYEVLGPILWSYCGWLHKASLDSGAKIWFAARDMFCFKKAYEILYGEENNYNNFEYVYISRKSLRPLYASVTGNILNSCDIFPRDKYSISQIAKYMGYGIEDINNSGSVDIFEKKYIARNLIKYKELENILNSDKIIEAEKCKSSLAKQYLEKKGLFTQDIILADVGWHGTTQFILQKIQKELVGKERVCGYYLGDLEGTCKRVGKGNAHMLYFDENSNSMFSKGTMLFEALIAATHGTTISYRKYNGDIEPVLAKGNQVESCIAKIQEGALKFVKDYKESIIADFIDISPEFSMMAFEQLVEKPRREELDRLGRVVYDDNGQYMLAMPKSYIKYIFNPKQLLKDLKYAPWRIGFIYKLFKLRLPYGKIYKMLRNVSGKKA